MRGLAAGALVLSIVGASAVLAQRTDVFVDSRDHPAIRYTAQPATDPIARLNGSSAAGPLTFDPDTGYLRSVLERLRIPVASQTLVFSQTSAQASDINRNNPRAIYFNDSAAVGWVRGADLLELAAQDPQQGVIFYTLEQKPAARPRFARRDECLQCHLTWDTLGVPGFQVLSTFQMSDDPNAYASGEVTDHRTPVSDRWGGWFVTGRSIPARHRGNVPVIVPAANLTATPPRPPKLDSLAGVFDTRGYLSRFSDIVALMVLEHQSRAANLITRVGWEARLSAYGRSNASGDSTATGDRATLNARAREAVRDLADYLLFVDEAPLPTPVEGSSGFAEWFAAQGPADSHGRSLRQLDLRRRMLRFPCSYMVYSPAFDALPRAAKDETYARLWQILSGQDRAPAYAALTPADRQAIIEILRDTKTDLPAEFRGPVL